MKIAMSIANGVLQISGTSASGAHVDATGSLLVGISRTSTGSTLTFNESGVAAAEQALEIASPFTTNGKPTTVPVKVVHRSNTC
jgi:hypothetical protein